MRYMSLIFTFIFASIGCQPLLAQGIQDNAVVARMLNNDTRSAAKIENVAIATSVGSNALTIALKQADGSTNASSSRPAIIAYRSSTITNGGYSSVRTTGALSVVVSSGSTLGCTDAVACELNVYALNNAGATELAVINGVLDEGALQSSTAEGGAGAADSAGVLYSTTARSNVTVRFLAKLLSTQATAGTYASAITSVHPLPYVQQERRKVVASKSATYTAQVQDDVIIFTADATLNLKPAAGLTGKVYEIITTGSTTKATIDPNSTETVCGQTTIKVTGADDSVKIISDGSNWQGLDGSCARTYSIRGITGTNSVGSQTTGCWSSSSASTGQWSIALDTGCYSGTVHCTCTNDENSGSGPYCNFAGLMSGGSVTIRTRRGGTLENNNVDVVCRAHR